MSTTWYTSDLHIGHKRVSGLRGFSHPDEHDAWLIETWRGRIDERDTVFVLGDIAVSRVERALDIIADLPGTKHLVAGNHDPVAGFHTTRFDRWTRLFDQAFASVHDYRRRKIDGQDVALSHYPYAAYGDGPERAGSRYDQWRLPDLGMPLLHGHTHEPGRGHGHQLHVGLDAWGAPVHEREVISWLRDLDTTNGDCHD